jgi:hypothetical protein
VATFVINEWLWSDLSGENGTQRQRETFIVIERLPASDHRIVVIERSPFDQKAWSLCKNANPIVQRIASLYVTTVRQNTNRCLILTQELLVALPENLASSTKPDDHYLVQAQLSVDGAILISTDNPLREATGRAGLRSLSREEFLDTYF